MLKPSLVLGAIAISLSTMAVAKEWTTVRVAIDPTYKPFTYKTESGQPTGFDVDTAESLCQAMKAKCVYVEQVWDSMIPGLQARKYDAIISSMSITEERAKVVAFTGKYYNTPSKIVINKQVTSDGSPASLKGKNIGVLKGSTQEAYAQGELAPAGVNVVSYEAQDQVYLDMKSGRLDGTVADVLEVQGGFLDTADGKGYQFVGNPLASFTQYFGTGAGIAVRKSNTDLKDQLNAAIQTIRANGEWQKNSDKYFKGIDIWGE